MKLCVSIHAELAANAFSCIAESSMVLAHEHQNDPSKLVANCLQTLNRLLKEKLAGRLGGPSSVRVENLLQRMSIHVNAKQGWCKTWEH